MCAVEAFPDFIRNTAYGRTAFGLSSETNRSADDISFSGELSIHINSVFILLISVLIYD